MSSYIGIAETDLDNLPSGGQPGDVLIINAGGQPEWDSSGISPFLDAEPDEILYANSLGELEPVAGLVLNDPINGIDRRIAGLTGTLGEKLLLSTVNPNVSYVRSMTCWAADIDTTPIAVWCGEGGTNILSSNGWKRAIAISPIHVVMAVHFSPAIGQTFDFLTKDNVKVTRTLVARVNVIGTDIYIGKLSSELPDTISFCRILPNDYTGFSLIGMPVLELDQTYRVLVNDITADNGVTITTSNPGPTDATRAAFFETLVSGDSSSPFALVVGNELVLLASAAASTGGPSLAGFRVDVDAAMTTLGGGYTTTAVVPRNTLWTHPPYWGDIKDKPSALNGLIDVTEYGAITGAGGAATNKNAIETAAAAALAAGTGIYFPKIGGFQSSLAINLPSGIHVIMDDELIDTGPANRVFLKIGEAGPDTQSYRIDLKLSVRRNTLSDWLDETNIGIQLYSCAWCFIRVVQCTGFTCGLEGRGGANDGFTYNTIFLQEFLNNRTHIRLTSTAGGQPGYCNENKFFGGSLTYNTGVNVGIQRIGIHVTSDGVYEQSGNVFFGTSIELFAFGAGGAGVACKPVWVERGEYNAFWAGRNEGNDVDPTVYLFEDSSPGENTSYQYYEFGNNGTGKLARTNSPTFTTQISTPRSNVTGASVVSTPATHLTGAWFTGGSATTTKPHWLVQPTGTTSAAWSTSGTGVGVNAASGFAGNLLDAQLNGVVRFSVNSAGLATTLNLRSTGYVQADAATATALYAPNGGLFVAGAVINTFAGAGSSSVPAVAITGTVFSGGSSTTTKPKLLVEPTGTTSTGWSTGGTGIGINLASGFAGNLFDVQVSGASKFSVSSAGVARVAAGGATDTALVGGTLSVNTTGVGNVGVGEDDLITYSVPASTLGTNNDYIEFSGAGTIASNVNAKRIKVYFGATVIFDTGAAGIPISAAIDFTIQGKIFRTGAATQKCMVSMNTNNATLASYSDYATAAETLSGAVTLKVTGEAVSNDDVRLEILEVKWQPNNS